MGDLDGSVRYVRGGIQQLRLAAGGEPDHPSRYLCPRMSAPAGTTAVRNHAFAGKDTERAGHGTQNPEPGLVGSPNDRQHMKLLLRFSPCFVVARNRLRGW